MLCGHMTFHGGHHQRGSAALQGCVVCSWLFSTEAETSHVAANDVEQGLCLLLCSVRVKKSHCYFLEMCASEVLHNMQGGTLQALGRSMHRDGACIFRHMVSFNV